MIEVEKTGAPKTRRLYAQADLTSGIQFRVHNHSFANLRRGLLERVFFVENKSTKELVSCPSPEPNAFSELAGLRKLFIRYCGVHSRISAEQFVDCYQGRKRTVYDNAAKSLLEVAISKEDSHLKTFIKAEKFNIFAKPDPAPRVIQPRSPRYNVELGRYLKKFEHTAYRAIDKIWGGPTVMKGYNSEQVALHMKDAWDQFQIPVAVGFDMSRFDQHVSVPALQFEHSCYEGCFPGDRWLRTLLKWQLTNYGVGFASNGMIRYTKKGCRMSGDMNTALGNCLLACFITKHLMKGLNCRLVNNGDDCVLFLERRDLGSVVSNLTTGWSKFGFNCIAEEPVYTFERVQFCQMQPVFDGKTWIMVRNPRVSLSKDAVSLVHWTTEKNAKQWFKAVGMGGIRVTGGIPVMQNFYRKYISVGGDVVLPKENYDMMKSGYYKYWAANLKRGFAPVAPEARYSFYLAFGVTPDEQLALEKFIDEVELRTPFDNETSAKDVIENPLSWIIK